MGVYDQAARFAAQADPGAVPQRLLSGRGVSLRFRDWLDTRTVPLPGGPDRTADLVAALDDPTVADQPWLLVLELQAQVDPEKLDATLEEVAFFAVGPDTERIGRVRTRSWPVWFTCKVVVRKRCWT